METILEKVTFILNCTKRNEQTNKMEYPSEFVLLFLKGDPDLDVIENKARKVIDLFNEAEAKGDIEFLNRDFETDIWNLIEWVSNSPPNDIYEYRTVIYSVLIFFAK